MEGKKSKIQTITITLMVLLVISIFALIGLHAYKDTDQNAVVTDNVITNEQLVDASSSDSVEISLNSSTPEVNQPFEVSNMFPGDTYTKDFSVKVSHKKDVTLCFKADVRQGYEKLAEVLKCTVTIGNSQTLYDGLMKDMPEYVSTVLKTDTKTTSTMDYHIAAYLDTSVGNEYQDKDLIADFKWWVIEDEYLVPDTSSTALSTFTFPIVGVGALVVVVVLLMKKRKDAQDEQG